MLGYAIVAIMLFVVVDTAAFFVIHTHKYLRQGKPPHWAVLPGCSIIWLLKEWLWHA